MAVLANHARVQEWFENNRWSQAGFEIESWFLCVDLVAKTLEYVFRAGEQCPVMLIRNSEKMLFVSLASPSVMWTC